jgi:hypothetical protein
MKRHRHQEFIRFLNAVDAQVPRRKDIHDQSGRTSAPISPKRVQAMREHSALYVGKAA